MVWKLFEHSIQTSNCGCPAEINVDARETSRFPTVEIIKFGSI